MTKGCEDKNKKSNIFGPNIQQIMYEISAFPALEHNSENIKQTE